MQRQIVVYGEKDDKVLKRIKESKIFSRIHIFTGQSRIDQEIMEHVSPDTLKFQNKNGWVMVTQFDQFLDTKCPWELMDKVFELEPNAAVMLSPYRSHEICTWLPLQEPESSTWVFSVADCPKFLGNRVDMLMETRFRMCKVVLNLSRFFRMLTENPEKFEVQKEHEYQPWLEACPWLSFADLFESKSKIPLALRAAACMQKGPHTHEKITPHFWVDIVKNRMKAVECIPESEEKSRLLASCIADVIEHQLDEIDFKEISTKEISTLYFERAQRAYQKNEMKRAFENLKKSFLFENSEKEYERYHMMGEIGWFANEFAMGKMAAQIAFQMNSSGQNYISLYP
jgi:hypothetical protein